MWLSLNPSHLLILSVLLVDWTRALKIAPCTNFVYMNCRQYCKHNCQERGGHCIYHCENGCGCDVESMIVHNNGGCIQLMQCLFDEDSVEETTTRQPQCQRNRIEEKYNENGDKRLFYEPNEFE